MTTPITEIAATNINAGPDPDLDAENEENEQEESPRGDFLDETTWPDEKLAKHLIAEWTSRDEEMRPRLLSWYVNRLRRGGQRWVGLKKSQDRNEWSVYVPPGGKKAPPTLGKAARLCRRLTGQMYQDPPTPEAIPATDADEDRSAAEFSSRLLQALGSEASLNNARLARRAFNKSHTYGSGFRHWWVDPYGGGQAAKKLRAHPGAIGADDALIIQGPNGPEQVPESGLAWRMVTPDGQFTDDETLADRIWLPAIRGEVLTGNQVRMFPATATSIDEADSAYILSWTTLGQLKARFPEVFEDLDEEKLKKLVHWVPNGIDLRYLLPDHLTESDVSRSRNPIPGSEGIPDHAIVCTLLVYQEACFDHPEGAVMHVGGPDILLRRDPWMVERDGRRLFLEIPIDQTKGYDEGEDDPYGKGTMDFLGPGDELLASIDSSWIAHFERFSNRKVFIPITSALQSKVASASMGTYVPINPGGKPEVEEIPNFPQDSINLRDTVVLNMDDESGMQLTAQGVDSPNVQSGFHAVQVIEQVLAGLSEMRQNAADALERGWRIQLQLIRGFYTTPQETRFLGPEQDYKYEYWMATDLGSTTDVRIMRGTFSMMTPAMKSSIAVSMSQVGVITPYELRRFTIGSTGGLIGVQDDPHWMRVNRQVANWLKGPEKAGTDDPFPAIPADTLIPVATVRVEELSRAMAGTFYHQTTPEWRAVLDQAFQAALQAAFPPPPPDPNAPPAPASEAAPALPPELPPPPGDAALLPVDDGGVPPDAGLAGGLPPAAEFPDLGPPALDGAPVPPPSLATPANFFSEL